MKLFLSICLILFAVASKSQSSKIDTIYGYPAVQGEYLIKLKPYLKSTSQYAEVQKRVSLAKSRYKINIKKNWTTVETQLWQIGSGKERINQDTIKNLIGRENIEYIEPNYIISANISKLPTDPMFKDQWSLNNTDSQGVSDVDIDAPEGWDFTKGSSDVIVGVFDTGFDYHHEDLKNNIWTNPNEIPGNGKDDDNNGYVDDIHGYDFIANDGDPMDENYHGTHVAGIIAAEENGIGVVGVAPKAKLISLRILDSKGIGATSAAIDAFEYAIKNKIKITNHSWGGPHSLSLKEVIDRTEQNNILLIVASGNNAINQDYTPTSYPASYKNSNIITVGSHDRFDKISPFSNVGLSSVDLYAPGSDILSTFPNNKYSTLSGTSMSTPFVTGAIALLKSYYPQKSEIELKNQLLGAVERSTAYEGLCVSGGRLNLYNLFSGWSPVCINLASQKMSFYGVKVNDKSNELQNIITNLNAQNVKLDSLTCSESFYFSGSLSRKINDITINGAATYPISLIFSPKKTGVYKGYLNIYYKSGSRQLITKCLLDGVGFEKGTLVQNQVSGTWTKAMSPIIVNSDLYIEDQKGLEIQAGVEVIFTGHFKISCDYKSWIKAKGTASDSIYFHPIDEISGWNGIKLYKSDSVNPDSTANYTNEFEYCKFYFSKNNTLYRAELSDDQMNGGAIMSMVQNLKISRCLFYGNSSWADGGAIYVTRPVRFILESCTFDGNSARWSGACGFHYLKQLNINNCIFKNNTSGAGILKLGSINYATISNSVFLKNGSNQGAAISSTGNNTIVITNSLFAQNHNCAYQAPIEVFSSDSVVVSNNTIVENWGNQGGGIFMAECSNIFLRNNIIWDNSRFQIAVLGNYTNYITEYNDIQNWPEGSKNISTDPKFEDKIKYFLSVSSPCINSGIPYTLFADNDNSRNDIGYTGGNGLSVDFLQVDFKSSGISSVPSLRKIRVYNNSTKQYKFRLRNFTSNFLISDTSSVSSYSKKFINIEFKPKDIGIAKDSLEISCDNKLVEVKLIGEGVTGKSLSGKLSGRLSCQGSPFIVTGNIIVEINDTLVIDPCVDLFFLPESSLTVKGTLIANGKVGDNIIFDTQIKDQTWNGIEVSGNATFQNCQIKHLKKISVPSQSSGSLKKHFILYNSILTENSSSQSLFDFSNNINTIILLDRCKIFGNTCNYLVNTVSAFDINITNSLIVDNRGQFINSFYSKVNVVNCTIANNHFYNVKIANPLLVIQSGNVNPPYKGVELNLLNSILWNPEMTRIYSLDPYGKIGGRNSLKINNCILFYPKDSLKVNSETNVQWANNIISSPDFIDDNQSNYKLAFTSKGIDSGENSYFSSKCDIDYKERIWDGDSDGIPRIDIGCYEYNSTTYSKPIAYPGSDQIVSEGMLVSLNGFGITNDDSGEISYKWYSPQNIDLAQSNSSNPTFFAPNVKKDTILTFTLIINNGMMDSEPSTVKVTVKNVINVGISDIPESGLKIYPNPSNGIFKIEGLPTNPKNKITIHTIEGKSIRRKITYSTGETIDISDQISGIYLLNVNNQIHKIVKE